MHTVPGSYSNPTESSPGGDTLFPLSTLSESQVIVKSPQYVFWPFDDLVSKDSDLLVSAANPTSQPQVLLYPSLIGQIGHGGSHNLSQPSICAHSFRFLLMAEVKEKVKFIPCIFLFSKVKKNVLEVRVRLQNFIFTQSNLSM